MQTLHEEILEAMKKRMECDEYVNPHFMQTITTAIFDYYEVEDDDLDQWIMDTFSR